jgi:hypothetical protein
MWSLNEWCDCMLWLGVLKTVFAMEHECDFRVSIKFGNMMIMKLMHEWKCLNWFKGYECVLWLRFKLRKYWLMNLCVKLFMESYWRHVLKHDHGIGKDMYCLKGVWIDLKGINVCCGWDLNYVNIGWWIYVLNCLWNLIEGMC